MFALLLRFQFYSKSLGRRRLQLGSFKPSVTARQNDAITATWVFLMTPDENDDIDLTELAVHYYCFLDAVLTSPIPVTCKLGGPMDFVLFLWVLHPDATFDPDANKMTKACAMGQFLLRTTRLMKAWVTLQKIPRYVSPMEASRTMQTDLGSANLDERGGDILAIGEDPMENADTFEDEDDDSDTDSDVDMEAEINSDVGYNDEITSGEPVFSGADNAEIMNELVILESSEPVELLDVSDENDILR